MGNRDNEGVEGVWIWLLGGWRIMDGCGRTALDGWGLEGWR